ncbi:hypothetical protein NW762_002466 [Fusarium torreyae]|uniref:Uncharacterized protein n=1 Tax=Fusarium torreyae TaxID=1237075 RepID=A0A9W8SC68_9HYPO|nr:hypothetical protein NW762_002466 [Fusarium torreyae]
MDTQGVGISSGTMTRFASDSLRFTGIDLGGQGGDYSEDSEDDSESSEDEEFEQYIAQLALRDREEALVQSARYRIDRARAKGRTDVDLNDEEIAALQRRRERDEAEKKKKKSSKKNRGSRVAIPLTQLEPSSRKKKAPPVSHQPGQQSRPRQSSSNSNLTEDQDRQSYPPMGYFPPPATAGRPRSGTSSRPPSTMRGQRAPSTSRHPSDGGRRGRKPPPYGEIPMPGMSSSRSTSQAPLDPFQFQDPGNQAPSPAGSWRQFSAQRRRSSQQDGSSEEDSDDSDDDSSEEEREESTSSDAGSGGIVVEQDASPSPEPQPVRRNPPRSSTTSSSTKQRKPAKSTRKRK